MQITIACGAMPFGPNTPDVRSLGGSETATLMLAKALAKRGHTVTLFCNLPPEGAPDFVASGTKVDGVRFVAIAHYNNFITVSPTDLLIAVRDPQLAAVPARAHKKVLWMHDIATVRGYKRAFEQMGFTFDEVWTVSEWHKHQVAETTGYPLERIVALRNGIVQYDDIIEGAHLKNEIVYASRPERGLENLVKEGGVMENLPEFKLRVAMYEHFPEHMKDFYGYIMNRMKVLPNVEFIGGKSNHSLRQIIADSAAYIYPTQFEETSCILARECIEQGTPFLTTSVGALPETLGGEGIYFEDWLHANGVTEPERGSTGWCKLFAQFFRDTVNDAAKMKAAQDAMYARVDLDWDGVAEMVDAVALPDKVSPFSALYSLIQDGDVIPARKLFAGFLSDMSPDQDLTPPMQWVHDQLAIYDFVDGDLGKYYDDFYREKGLGELSELKFSTELGGPRHQAILEQINALPPGAKVFEYGCGPGHIIGYLAKAHPDKKFIGFDHSSAATDCVNEGALANNLHNLGAVHDLHHVHGHKFDAVICSEVLEHVVEPWKLVQEVESFAHVGARVIFTTPFGPWEPISFEEIGRWRERFHLWEIDRLMFTQMIGPKKPNFHASMIVAGQSPYLRPLGNYVFTYDADHEPTNEINAIEKAERHAPRETVAAAIIAFNNEDTIVKMLNSIEHAVQFVQIAHGPSTDTTLHLIEQWFARRPHLPYKIIDVPKIEPYKFGFDDARNASVAGLDRDFDWVFWIDTDEWLVGDFKKYLRPSMMDSYLISQHHFTVEPRGKAPEIDRPARLFRTDRHFRANGHIHEHFEQFIDGKATGPGRALLLNDVDIGHPGYTNEAVRQKRFFRNLPFLEWEHKTDPDRKLHKFLWFRDLIHKIRFASRENPAAGVAMAHEAVRYYNENQEDMSSFGPGMFQSLAYLTECYTILGKGVPLSVAIRFDDRSCTVEGRFESYEQFEKVSALIIKTEIAERTGRYY